MDQFKWGSYFCWVFEYIKNPSLSIVENATNLGMSGSKQAADLL